MTKTRARLIIPIVMPLLANPLAYGQELDAAEATAPGPIDEIIVTAPQSLSALKTAVDKAQDVTFAVLNNLIEDPDFHITCRMERPFKDGFDPIPVHREVRVCETRYFRRESQRTNEDYLAGFGDGQTNRASAHKEELNQKVNDLIAESPEFRQAMAEYVVLKREYDAAKEQEMSTGFFNRLFGSKKKDVP